MKQVTRYSLPRFFSFILFLTLICSTAALGSTDRNPVPVEISGTVIDAETGEPLPGVNVSVPGRVIGTATRADGTFTLTVSGDAPITIAVSMIGYQTEEIEILENQISGLVIELEEQIYLGSDVVVSASRMEEGVLAAPVTVEKMDIISVNQTPSDTYYKALANLKGVDMTTSSINFQIVNSRGFNSTGNTRMVQLVDGMDTQAPALNFPISNLNGPSELDVESVEFIPGAASALYGPNAFNGILQVRSKSPFEYQGLSIMLKSGANHFDGAESLGEPGSPSILYDTSLRYAEVLSDRFAFKFNFSYSQADDWRGINFTDKNSSLQSNLLVNPAYDGVHLYGDDGSFNIGLLAVNPATRQQLAQILSQQTGVPQSETEQYIASIPAQPVNRTGYEEQYLVDYGAENMKVNGSMHYRFSDHIEGSYTMNYGYGTSVYTGAQRYSLKNFNITQHKFELRGDNFMARAYGTFENSGDSYIADFVGYSMNEAYSPSATWFPTYGVTFAGALMQLATETQSGNPAFNPATVQAILSNPNFVSFFHQAARQSADANRIQPGSAEFSTAMDAALQSRIPEGALFDDKSRFYHFEGQYDFKNEISFVDLLAGASFRQFNLRSNGTIFDDADGIDINEFGGYLQASREVVDDLRLTGSIRYDKNENFDGQISPRLAAVLTVAGTHNIRGSFQTGFRNPTTQGQYIDLNVVTARLLGGLPRFAEKYSITENTYTYDSVVEFSNQFLSNPGNPVAAVALLEPYSVHNPVKPEQIKAFEIGYKGLINNRLLVDAAYYYNIYDDFITQIRVRRASGPFTGGPGDQLVIGSLLSGNFENTYQIYTNIDNTVHAQGAVIGFDYSLPGNYRVGVNYNWNQLISDLGTFQNDFNTPEHKVNVSFGNRRVTENLGFNVVFRWQDAFRWESTFAFADIDAVSTLDAQIMYRLPEIRSVIKLGGSNILNSDYILNGGGPNLGAIYYISLTYDSIFRR